jgi:octanoyl-[GcvH]:protein N-octanoyltransferase
MRVLRGRAADPERDRATTRRLAAWAGENRQPAVRVWRPHPTVAFGRRDTTSDGYERALQAAAESGYAVVERSVGGHAVAFTGTTVAFLRAEPVDDARTGIGERYDRVTGAVARALAGVGATVEQGEPDRAFCPGTHSLSAHGKIAGLAQRVRREVALTSGVVVVRDHDRVAEVLGPVYEALDIPLDRDAVGSVARAGGTGDPEQVTAALQSSLATDPAVEWVREA